MDVNEGSHHSASSSTTLESVDTKCTESMYVHLTGHDTTGGVAHVTGHDTTGGVEHVTGHDTSGGVEQGDDCVLLHPYTCTCTHTHEYMHESGASSTESNAVCA